MDIDAFWQLITDSLEHAPGRAAREHYLEGRLAAHSPAPATARLVSGLTPPSATILTCSYEGNTNPLREYRPWSASSMPSSRCRLSLPAFTASSSVATMTYRACWRGVLLRLFILIASRSVTPSRSFAT